MIQKLWSTISSWFSLAETEQCCPECGSTAVSFIDVSWTVGPQAWACFACDWIDI